MSLPFFDPTRGNPLDKSEWATRVRVTQEFTIFQDKPEEQSVEAIVREIIDGYNRSYRQYNTEGEAKIEVLEEYEA